MMLEERNLQNLIPMDNLFDDILILVEQCPTCNLICVNLAGNVNDQFSESMDGGI